MRRRRDRRAEARSRRRRRLAEAETGAHLEAHGCELRWRWRRAVTERIHPHAELEIEALIPYPGNPRRGNIDAIKQSLERNGQYAPLIVNRRTMEVLVGSHRLFAARELGWRAI